MYCYAELIRKYIQIEDQNFLDRLNSDHRRVPPSNYISGEYLWLIEHIQDYIKSRTMRAWHYTCLTEDEVRHIEEHGILLPTLETIRRRLDLRVASGDFKIEVADALFAASPFHHHEQTFGRVSKFWMTSHPVPSDDSGVELLLGNWGGEGVYFWLQDRTLKEIVKGIGRPRVIELAVPVEFTSSSYSAAEGVIGAFARSLGLKPDKEAFDLYSNYPIGPDAVI